MKQSATVTIRCDSILEIGYHLKNYGLSNPNWLLERIEVYHPESEPRYYMVYLEMEEAS